jgi:hypothetical protein
VSTMEPRDPGEAAATTHIATKSTQATARLPANHARNTGQGRLRQTANAPRVLRTPCTNAYAEASIPGGIGAASHTVEIPARSADERGPVLRVDVEHAARIRRITPAGPGAPTMST